LPCRKMHRDEIEINALSFADCFPEWVGLSVEPVMPLGTDNALYRLGNEMVVRLPHRERTSQTLEKERRWLPKLGSPPISFRTHPDSRRGTWRGLSLSLVCLLLAERRERDREMREGFEPISN
jgi:hypothetical protein